MIGHRADEENAMKGIVAAILIFVLLVPAAWAQSETDSEIEGAALPQVQLLSFMAPIRKKSKRDPANMPITFTFEVVHKDDIRAVCRMAPRIRNAIMEVLYRRPLRIGADRKLDVRGLDRRVKKATNRALGRKLVSGVIVTPGVQHMRTGGARFAGSIACAAIEAKDKKKKK